MFEPRLNPDWVEQFMGLPVGTTRLPTSWANDITSAGDPLTHRIDRIRMLGNSVVPQTAARAFSVLLDRVEEIYGIIEGEQ